MYLIHLFRDKKTKKLSNIILKFPTRSAFIFNASSENGVYIIRPTIIKKYMWF